MSHAFALKGNIIFSKDRRTLTWSKDAYLICEDGAVTGVFPELPERFHGIEVTDCGDRLILPGLCDLHLHAPQYAFRGLGMDLELLPWLNTYTFPAEAKYADPAYAQAAYRRFAKALERSATTRASIFATLHLPATRLLMDLVEQTGVHAYIGKVNMDRNSIPALTEETERSAADTEAWILDSRGRYQNVRPILTPRFIPSCSDALMERLGTLQRKYRLPVQSHLSENRAEIAWVRELHPDTACYGEAYLKYGLFGCNCPTIMAHCVHPNERELELLEQNGVYIAHCPESNMNLSSGVAPVRTYLEHNMRVGLGTDVAGGCSLSLFQAMAEAIRSSKLRWALQDASLAPLSVPEAFYLATRGGGEFFGRVGAFDPGYEFDAVVIDDSSFDTMGDYASLPQRLERLIYLADDRVVVGKYVAGRKLFGTL